jgi:quercetin 2,3-dioxygenase
VRPEGIAGFQLWVNLPANLKMTAPRYQNILAAEIPEIKREDGTRIRVITGEVDGTQGPVSGIAANPTYMDVSVPPHSKFTHAIANGNTAFAYLFQGEAKFSDGDAERVLIRSPQLVVWGEGDFVDIATDESPARFLLVSGKPLHEPVARYGPFVMNTREEIEEALRDLRQGTFA